MKTTLYKSNERGHANHGWLNTYHTFNFGNYYHPNRTNFGSLRVFNDDFVQPRAGFGKHPHDNMEIVSIVLDGELSHEDSMGNKGTIRKNEIQVMSAGSGIFHSEFNSSKSEVTNFLQVWIYPKEKGITPTYGQASLHNFNSQNNLSNIISPRDEGEKLSINQNTWFYMGEYDQSKDVNYNVNDKNNGVYIFIIEGGITINNYDLTKRDAVGVYETDSINFTVEDNSRILLIETPMEF